MKIEIGESLLYSWLRHSKGCQLVQMNWKSSSNSWELKNEEIIQKLMEDSSQLFKSKYDFSLFKGTASLSQLLQQAEIDVVGVDFSIKTQHVFAVDVAFHEAGLNYGSKEETANRVAKKIIRAAMCLMGYFDIKEGEIIFASPKIHNATFLEIMERIPSVQGLLQDAGLNYKVKIIANEDFSQDILQPVIESSSSVADTSELFMRSMQLYNLFSSKKPPIIKPSISKVTTTNEVNDMKIGKFVKHILTNMLLKQEISQEEIEWMQTEAYSKNTFDIQYPLLRKTALSNGKKVSRYWADEIEIYNVKYFICSEWYETQQNNDRPYFMKWLALRT